MSTPRDDIREIRAAHARLHQSLSGLDEAGASRASLLPGWSIGHVLTHIARNADSVVRRLEGAMRGETLSQYPGGVAGRAAEIEAGANRSAAELVADVHATNERLEAVLDEVPAEIWAGTVLDLNGNEMPTTMMAFIRWREVETHHVDLGLGYTSRDWPQALVDKWLPLLVDDLAGRADDRNLMAWLLGRGPAPMLGPWG